MCGHCCDPLAFSSGGGVVSWFDSTTTGWSFELGAAERDGMSGFADVESRGLPW